MSDPRLGDLLADRVVETREGCWLWLGRLGAPVGQLTIGGRKLQPHTVMWELLHGAVPRGHNLKRLCGERRCVNPAHRAAVPVRAIVTASSSAAGRNRRKSRCSRGHPFDEANTHIQPDGSRRCRACARDRWRERGAARRRERKAADA